MAAQKVFPTANGRPVDHGLPAANPETSQLMRPRPPVTVAAPEVPQAEGQGAWAWASDELKHKLRAMFRDEARASEPSPARKFVAGFGFGAIGLGDKLGLNPHREIEKLKTANDALTDRVQALEARPKRQRRKQKFGGRGVKKDNDYWLDRWERDVAHEVKSDGYARNETLDQMKERVYGLGSVPAAQAINDRYRKENNGKNVVSASSLRRRHPSTWTTNARGEAVKVKGAFVSKRWGQWERYRNGKELDGSLAEGSTKMECSEENKDSDKPTPTSGAGRITATGPATQEDEDKRKRSVFDGGLEIATVRDLAEAAIAKGELVKHEGGLGILHVRAPADEVEFRENAEEETADEYFRALGLDPHAVHKRLKDGQAEMAN